MNGFAQEPRPARLDLGVASEAEADRAAEKVPDAPRQDGWTLSQDVALLGQRLGHDLSHVRLHADSRSAEMAEALNAEAFTVGQDIYLGAGGRHPGTAGTRRLLAHELAHVVQQSRTGPALQAKLKITGKPSDLTRTVALLNSGLQKFRVSIDSSGVVSITENFVELDPNAQQKALADRLKRIIDDAHETVMTVSAGSKTLVGSYATGDFDISDVEKLGAPGLIHEIEEQYQKQVKGMAYGSETKGAHHRGIEAESEVRGAKRGAQRMVSSTVNSDGTLDAVVEIPHTFPDGTVKTMVLQIKSNNVESVTWK